MSNQTQAPVDGLFDRDTGQLVGFTDGLNVFQSPVSGGWSGSANTIILDGDSITARYYEGSFGIGASSYFAWFNAYLQQAFRVVGCVAVSGQDSSACLGRFDSYVATSPAKIVSLMIGINNIGTPDQVISDITSYIAKCKAIGKRLLLWTVLPSTSISTQAKRRGWSIVNKWITSLAGTDDAIEVVLAHEAWLATSLVSSGLYSPPASYVEDGTHPTFRGAQAIGKYAATQKSAQFPGRRPSSAVL